MIGATLRSVGGLLWPCPPAKDKLEVRYYALATGE
jgi:hypothetical protein